jgi:excisionase family DNA binding protein
MTIKEAAERLEISRSLCYRLVEEGRLKCLRIGQEGRRGKIIVRESDIAAFLDSCERKVTRA